MRRQAYGLPFWARSACDAVLACARTAPACLSGEQHQSYVLYSRLNGRRFSVYVPEELVPELRRCVDNGRALQELLQEAAPRYVKALKRERANTSKSKKS